MKRFKFHERFTTMDIEKFPNGWILRTDLPKYSDPSVSPVSYSNLINNIIFVDPGIWGDDELKREYWKQNTYHPSLSKMNLDHVKKNVIFIGKIIKKKPKQKKQKKIYYDTLLMINSADQYNEFDQKQCKEMMTVINESPSINNDEKTKSSRSIPRTEKEIVTHFVKDVREKIVQKKSGVQSDEKNNSKSSEKNNSHLQKEKSIVRSSIQRSSIQNTVKKVKRRDTKDDPKNNDKEVSKKNKKGQMKRNSIDTSDFFLQQGVAFDFKDEIFSNRFKSEMKIAEVPEEALLESRFISGHVFERVSKKKKESFANYKVAFEYSGEGMKQMEFSMQEIVRAIALNSSIKGTLYKSSKNVQDEQIPLPEQSKIHSIHGFNANDVEGEALESDDEFEEDEMKQTRHRLREGHYYFDKTLNLDRKKNHFFSDKLLDCVASSKKNTLESNQGLTWKKNEEIEAPSGILPNRKSYLKHQYKHHFRNEIESLLAFLPIGFWIYHQGETNKYMRANIAKDDQSESGSGSGSGNQCKDITIDELMIFYAIILQMAMKPFPGTRYTDCWKNENKIWWTTCNNMSKNRFQEIRASLHWCDNGLRDQFVDKETQKKDTLYKVRPLLSIIEANLGKYLTPCTELSLDETCVAIRSQWARAMTFYNPHKPKGKHHLKFYTLCENSHWCALEIKMCHRFKKDETTVEESTAKDVLKESQSSDYVSGENSLDEIESIGSDVEEEDDYDETSDNYSITSLDDEDVEDQFIATLEITDENIPSPNNDNSKEKERQSQCESVAQKTVQTVTSLCKNYSGSGRVINMDNLYSSPLVFIKLKEMSLYARGTVRLNRKYLPRFIQYKKKDMKKLDRGSYEFAVNKDYNMSMHCWHDKNPVHVLSTADSTQVEEVSRRSGRNKIVVKCPSTIKNYNKNMQAVDQFNKLMSLFSLAQAHSFTKYYKKIAMVLMDFVLVNSYLHYKLWMNDKNKNSARKPKVTRLQYMANLIDALIETDWADYARRYENMKSERSSGKKRKSINEVDHEAEDDHYFNDTNFELATPTLPPFQDYNICQAVSFDSKGNVFEVKKGEKYKSKFFCKVCQFEGRGNVRKGTVFCSNHGLSLCQKIQGHPKEKEIFTVRCEKINTKNINRWDWLSPNQNEWSCWQKAHNYYIPQGLFKTSRMECISIESFKNYSGFNFSSSPYLLRKVALENTYYKKIGKKSRKEVSKRSDST